MRPQQIGGHIFQKFNKTSENGHRDVVKEKMRQSPIQLMLAFLVVCCSCSQQGQHVSHPLLAKYFTGTTNEVFWVVQQDYQLFLVRHSLNSETRQPLSHELITQTLRDCRIAVTNEIVAADIGNLVRILQCGNRPDDYLIENVTRADAQWVVQSRYWEAPPDNAHRRSGGFVYTLLLGDHDLLTNIIVEALPPIVKLKTQNNRMDRTSQ